MDKEHISFVSNISIGVSEWKATEASMAQYERRCGQYDSTDGCSDDNAAAAQLRWAC